MQKLLLSLSITAALSVTTTIHAKPIPFIDSYKFSIKKPATVSQFNKIAIEKYVDTNELDLSSVGVQESDIPIIIVYLKEHPEITSLNLEGHTNLSSAALASFATVKTLTSLNIARRFKDCDDNMCYGGLEAKDTAAFANNTSLTSLNVSMNSIGDEGALALSKNSHLRKLDVSANDITDVGGLALAQIKSLEELALGGNEKISSKTAIVLSQNKSIRSVELQQTNVDDEGAIALASQLQLVNLLLDDNNITDKSAQAIANNSTIKTLGLAGNMMTATGANILATSTSLEYLDFSGDFFGQPRPNDVGDAGAIAFSHISTLEKLYLSSQQITSIGAIELGKSNLSSLDLTANYDLGDIGAAGLANKSWSDLEVSACSITDTGAEALAKSHYTVLYAISNYISDAGILALADKVYAILNVSDNLIHDEGAFALAKNGSMSALMISDNHISVIGIAALINARFGYLEIGRQYTLTPSNNNRADSSPISTSAKSSSNRKFCYRQADEMRCINKDSVIFSARRK